MIQQGFKTFATERKATLVANDINKSQLYKKQSLIFRRYESDQPRFSPNNNQTSSRKKVMRVKTLVNGMIFSRCFTKLFRHISKEIHDNGLRDTCTQVKHRKKAKNSLIR